MADEEYEILPHKLLADLKEDVDALKKKLMEPDKKANELILEIESLKDAVAELNEIFRKTLEEIKGEDSVAKDIKKIVGQNETIARGMVAISDKLEEFMIKFRQVSPPTMSAPPPRMVAPSPAFYSPQHMMSPPVTPGPRFAPPPQMEPPLTASPTLPLKENTEVDYIPSPPNRSPGGKKSFSLFR